MTHHKKRKSPTNIPFKLFEYRSKTVEFYACAHAHKQHPNEISFCSDRKSGRKMSIFCNIERASESVCITQNTFNHHCSSVEQFRSEKYTHFVLSLHSTQVDGKYFKTSTQIAHFKWNGVSQSERWEFKDINSSLFFVEKHTFFTEKNSNCVHLYFRKLSLFRQSSCLCLTINHTFMHKQFQHHTVP